MRVAINLKLVKMPERVIVATESFQRVAETQEDNLDEVIAAFDSALGKVLKRVVEWTLVTGAFAMTIT